MPESEAQAEKKKAVPPMKRSAKPQVAKKKAVTKKSPAWYAPTMITLMCAGLVWVVTTYITNSKWPIPGLGQWNLGVGFGLIIVGFIMTAGWK